MSTARPLTVPSARPLTTVERLERLVSQLRNRHNRYGLPPIRPRLRIIATIRADSFDVRPSAK